MLEFLFSVEGVVFRGGRELVTNPGPFGLYS